MGRESFTHDFSLTIKAENATKTSKLWPFYKHVNKKENIYTDSDSRFRNNDKDLHAMFQDWPNVYKSHLVTNAGSKCLATKKDECFDRIQQTGVQGNNLNKSYCAEINDYNDKKNYSNCKNTYEEDAFIETNTVSVATITTIDCGFSPDIQNVNSNSTTIDCGYSNQSSNSYSTNNIKNTPRVDLGNQKSDNLGTDNKKMSSSYCLEYNGENALMSCEQTCGEFSISRCQNIRESFVDNQKKKENYATESEIYKKLNSTTQEHQTNNTNKAFTSKNSETDINKSIKTSNNNIEKGVSINTDKQEVVEYNTINMDSINMYDINTGGISVDQNFSEDQKLYLDKKTEKIGNLNNTFDTKESFKGLLKGTKAHRIQNNTLKLKSEFKCDI